MFIKSSRLWSARSACFCCGQAAGATRRLSIAIPATAWRPDRPRWCALSDCTAHPFISVPPPKPPVGFSISSKASNYPIRPVSRFTSNGADRRPNSAASGWRKTNGISTLAGARASRTRPRSRKDVSDAHGVPRWHDINAMLKNHGNASATCFRGTTSLMVWSRTRKREMKRVLVIEDDKDIVELVRYNLEKDGYQVAASGDGSTGLAQIRKATPDLLILDLMLPKLSGLEICKEVRKDVNLNRLPILILTAKGEEADRVVGLELGADDYVTKPFSPRELAARVKALLRRAEPGAPSEKPREIGALKIDPAACRVTRGGKPVQMSTLEFRLLYFLAARPNRVFTRDQLLDAVWGTERFVTPRSVDVYVRRLREKIETDPQHPGFMKTIRGAGYLFETNRAS